MSNATTVDFTAVAYHGKRQYAILSKGATMSAPGCLSIRQQGRSLDLLPQQSFERQKASPMSDKTRHQLKVRHYECDPLGHVNHAVYVNYFEIGRLEAMAASGLPFSDVLAQGYTVVAADLYVQYKAPALSEDVLDMRSYIAHFRGARMTWQQELYRQASGELLALAEVNGAFTLANGRPVRIPQPMRSLLEGVYMPDAAWHASRPARRSHR